MSRQYLIRCLVFLCALQDVQPFQLLGAARPAAAARQGQTALRPDEVVPGVVIVKFKRGVAPPRGSLARSKGSLALRIARSGVTSTTQIFSTATPLTGVQAAAGRVDLSLLYYAYIDPSRDPRTVASAINGLQEVEYAEPKHVHHVNDTPNDPFFSSIQNTYFSLMNAVNGWTIAKGDSNVVIATVDGGTLWQHADLLSNLWINPAEDVNHNGRFDPGPTPAGDEDGVDNDGNGFVDDVIGWNFAANTNNPNGLLVGPTDFDHGTATASLFGAVTNNAAGMAGSSWNCRLMPVCATSRTRDNDIEFGFEGIQYAFSNGAKVINCSWGNGVPSRFEQDVVNAATQAGALIVCAAGNNSSNNDVAPFFPANYKNVLCVGATNSTNDVRAGFSNYGVTVPVYAPGVSIFTALSDGSYGIWDGTSFSSPLVAGLAGILKSAHPTWTPRQLATQIRVTADSIDNVNPLDQGKLGHGRVNFGRALSESHPGIEIVSSDIATPSGKTLFITGDTVLLHITAKNLLFTAANNLSFTASTSDAVLQVLQGTAALPVLGPDQQSALSDLKFRVGPFTGARTVVIKLEWRSNTNDFDAFAFKVTVFSSTPQWESLPSPVTTSLASVKVVDRSVIWAAGGDGVGTSPVVVRTTNGGENITDVTGNLTTGDLYCITAVDSNRAWVGTGDGKILATTNGGTTWNQQAYPGTQSPFIDGIWFFDTNNGVAMGDPATDRFIVLKTTNGGVTWAHVANEPAADQDEAGWNNSFWWTDPEHGWFGTNASRVWRTTDGGVSWSTGSTKFSNSFAVAFKDQDHGIGGFEGGGMESSTNGGSTWSMSTSPTAFTVVAVAFIPGTNVASVTDGGAVFRSTDNGNSWQSQITYPFDGAITHISFSDSATGWAVTSFGEILRYHPLVLGITNPGPIAQEYRLDQNYPNPFNSSTTISYWLPTVSQVTLRVYDMLGRVVKTLVDDQMQQGNQSARFDALSLASGVYFYRLSVSPEARRDLVPTPGRDGQAGSFTATRKLLLLK